MIELNRLQGMFDEMRAHSDWDIDGPMLWGYFFTDPSRERLEDAAAELERAGYRYVDIFLPEFGPGEDPYWFLHVEKEEVHSPASLHARNAELYAFAARRALGSYDGWDVGLIDAPRVPAERPRTPGVPGGTGTAYPAESLWTVSEGRYGQEPFIVRRNESARQLCGHPSYPYRLGVAIPLLAPDENGFPSADESELLGYIEDALSERLEQDQDSLLVLVFSGGGMREFVYYTRAPERADTGLRDVQAKFPSHDIQSYLAVDGGWEVYVQWA